MTIGWIVALIYPWIGTEADILRHKGFFSLFAAVDVTMGIYIGASVLTRRRSRPWISTPNFGCSGVVCIGGSER